MKEIVPRYWSVLKNCGCLNDNSRADLFFKLAEEKDFRKMMKAFMRHTKRHGKKLKVPSWPRKRIKSYEEAIKNLSLPSKKVTKTKRRKYIRQVGHGFPLLIPLLSSAVAAILSST